MKKYFPILTWLPGYNTDDFRHDIIAGATVAVMIIPQGMAYAMLAGLPPIMGLYAGLMPLVIYGIMGTSRHLAIGPVALDSILVASGIGVLAREGTPEYIQLAILLAFMVGVFQILMGIARLGFLVNFLSNPVISGFTAAAAFIIATSQLKHILGIPAAGSQQIFIVLKQILQHIQDTNFYSLSIGITSIGILVFLKRWKPYLPGALIVVSIGTFVVWFFKLTTHNVQIVGEIPHGFPGVALPAFSKEAMLELIPIALTVGIISLMEAVAISKRIAAQHKYTIDANQELRALGVANLSSGLMGGYSVGGSFARTAVNAHSGVKTPMSSLITAGIVALTLLFLTPLFYYMPRAVLAAIIITAVSGLVDIPEVKRIYKVKKHDFIVLLFAFIATIGLGVRYGLFLSVLLSLVMIIRRITRPHIAFLGQIPGTDILRNIKRVPNARDIPGLVILRMDASLYFANIEYFRDKLFEKIISSETPVKAVIFDASSINDIDASAVSGLFEIAEDLANQQIEWYFTNVKGPVRDILKRAGFYQKLGSDHFFFSKKDAVRYYLKQHQDSLPEVEEPVQKSGEND